jgi:ATP-dependent DNA helicase RecG
MEKLKKLGIHSKMDCIFHLPMRYEDETKLTSIADACRHSYSTVQIEGVIQHADIVQHPRKQLIITVSDETAYMTLRFINFYGSQIKQLTAGKRIRARGQAKTSYYGTEIIHPTYQMVSENTPLPTELTPVYPAAAGITQKYLRNQINTALADTPLTDTLPISLLKSLRLPTFERSIRFLHHPAANANINALSDRTHPAWQRIKFDELLAQQLSMRRARQSRQAQKAPPFLNEGIHSQQFTANLPFKLTDAQTKALNEILADLKHTRPMQRLLQGDVGSGKTIVSALAALKAIDNGYQVALMAPTEILAEQHYLRISEWLVPLGLSTVLLNGNMKKSERLPTISAIATGDAHFIVGTHALIQDDVSYANLGLVIIDEQHRFGVSHRLTLRQKGLKGQLQPHQLMMSATPIPRTLAMTFYADLDVSIIDKLPPGRTPVLTRLIDDSRREEVISRIHVAAKEGRQVYWVCPLIEESETLELQNAIETHEHLTQVLTGLNVGLLHGRMKPAEKQAVMADFQAGRIHVLVTTTVIEVGVDVPNASLMIIEHAERFGLSQLHQLRGRVGRGSAKSACLLLYQSPLGFVARKRLGIMRKTTDGFRIAQEDLEIRGPGEFLGARQSGQQMFRFADLEQDVPLIDKATDTAKMLLNGEVPDSENIIDAHLTRWLANREDFLNA